MFNSDGQKLSKLGFAVQVASLNQKDSFERKQAELKNKGLKNILINYNKSIDARIDYKIFIGPFSTGSEALNYSKSLKKKNVTGFIVDLTTL